MRVTLHRHGGFAALPGLDLRVTLDSADLPEEQGLELEHAVRRAGLDSLKPPTPVPDRRMYDLDVEDDDRLVSARVLEPLPNEELRDLVALLVARGRPAGGAG